MAGRNGGRYPKPTEFHKMEGTLSDAEIIRREAHAPQPVYLEEPPSPPDTLDDLASECWRINAPVLHSMGVLTAADLNTLYDYCVLFSAKMRAKEALDRSGEDGVIDWGTERRKPGMAAPLQVYLAVSKEMNVIAREFGMSATSRARMAIDVGKKDKDSDDMDSLFGGD